MNIQSISIIGSAAIKEDELVINHSLGLYAVIDGATSLTNFKNDRGETGGYLAARHLASYFENAKETDRLVDLVIDANDSLRTGMVEQGIDVLNRYSTWSAGFAAVRNHEFQIEYVQAADCMILGKYDDGTFRMCTRNQVWRKDKLALEKRREALSLGIDTPTEIREYILPTLKENRKSANTTEGYGVLNGDPNFKFFLESGYINKAGLSRIYLITDGLFLVTEEMDSSCTYLWKTIELIDQMGLEAYTNYLIGLEEADPLCINYIRNKKSDDKTGIIIDF